MCRVCKKTKWIRFIYKKGKPPEYRCSNCGCIIPKDKLKEHMK
jgi:ribosomal protein S26